VEIDVGRGQGDNFVKKDLFDEKGTPRSGGLKNFMERKSEKWIYYTRR